MWAVARKKGPIFMPIFIERPLFRLNFGKLMGRMSFQLAWFAKLTKIGRTF